MINGRQMEEAIEALSSVNSLNPLAKVIEATAGSELPRALAKLARVQEKALIDEGFSKEQAILLTAAIL